MQTQKFIRKPFEIEGIQVTQENMEEVADWCQGDILNASDTNQSPPFIKVRVHHPLTERQTKAFVGDWVLYAGKGYKVYTDKAFQRTFIPVVEDPDLGETLSEDPNQLVIEEVNA